MKLETVGDILAEMDAERHAIGANNPPSHEIIKASIDDLEVEARNWLDGEPIANADQAKAVATLIGMARDLCKAAEEKRKVAAKPFDDGKAQVQATWKPLIDRVERIAKAAKAAQTAWLVAEEARQRAEAARLAAEAEAAREAARIAYAEANPASLTEREGAEAALEAAAKAEAVAARATRQTATAKGDEGRAIGLRTYRVPVLVSLWDAAAHYFRARPDEFAAWVTEQAAKDVRAGVKSIPGFEIKEERKAA